MEHNFKAAIFDLDGVITKTEGLHARAWKKMFDGFLSDRRGDDENLEPFDISRDYLQYVDGKPRYDGVRSFLQSRDIEVPEGNQDDSPDEESIYGLGNRKNQLFQELLQSEGVEVYDDAAEQLQEWHSQGLKLALITSSRNGRRILDATGFSDIFEAVVDGNELAKLEIDGKPAPDVFLEAARRLNVDPQEAIVLEDAISGVQAGHAGDFGLVVGVARNGGDDLFEHGADVVVDDIRDVDLAEDSGRGSEPVE